MNRRAFSIEVNSATKDASRIGKCARSMIGQDPKALLAGATQHSANISPLPFTAEPQQTPAQCTRSVRSGTYQRAVATCDDSFD